MGGRSGQPTHQRDAMFAHPRNVLREGIQNARGSADGRGPLSARRRASAVSSEATSRSQPDGCGAARVATATVTPESLGERDGRNERGDEQEYLGDAVPTKFGTDVDAV